MSHPLVRRCLWFLPMLGAVALGAFLLTHVLPGDPASVLLGDGASPRQLAQTRHELGLDRPLPAQLLDYLRGLARGDLGESFFQQQPVLTLIRARLPATLELAFAATAFSVVAGVLLGMGAALWRGSVFDAAVAVFAQLGAALTVYWLAIVLVYVFAVQLQWLPAIGRGVPLGQALAALLQQGRAGPLLNAFSHLLLPAFALGLQGAALLSRLLRATLLEALASDYLRSARALGISRMRATLVHALPNALLPLVPLVGLQFGGLLGGAVLVESIVGWPGLGQLAVGALSQRDLPLIQGIVLVFAVLFAGINLFTDLVQMIVDPRTQEAS